MIVELVGESLLPKHHLSPQYAVVKIVREKYLKTTAFETQEEFQAFLSELYVYLVDQMHVALNQVGRNPGTCPVSWDGRPGVQHHWGSGLEAASSKGRGTFAFRFELLFAAVVTRGPQATHRDRIHCIWILLLQNPAGGMRGTTSSRLLGRVAELCTICPPPRQSWS